MDLFGWREGQSQVGASPWSALPSDFLVSYHLVCSAANPVISKSLLNPLFSPKRKLEHLTAHWCFVQMYNLLNGLDVEIPGWLQIDASLTYLHRACVFLRRLVELSVTGPKWPKLGT